MTKIEWCWVPGYRGESWNPVRARNRMTGKVGWHCEHKNEACRFCYAEALNRRLGTGFAYKPGHRDDIEIFLDEDVLRKPLHWKTPRAIFVHSMTDTFASFVGDEWLDAMFGVMELSPRHIFIVLTKRPARMRAYITGSWTPLPNVWFGTSVHDQPSADEFIPALLETPAAVRFVSYEPALAPVDFGRYIYAGHKCCIVGVPAKHPYACGDCDPCLNSFGYPLPPKIDQIIAGGESGPRKRPCDLAWFRSARDQCAAAGTAYFQKQIDKVQPIPPDLQIRQFPTATGVEPQR